ncbi:MAG TPA: type II toxin-antitoxin system RelE/ParE family toxin [Verrucomicrobiota bacterium]|nr:type II toxin-antitoxin system mRNA interferase toxin, RelE/StbE family [Verrucomicrobiales bacterium]HRI12581.1 type II toxin-antitoxin system RelE/ParE family toxin [Verrucomicrobiota bacterium]
MAAALQIWSPTCCRAFDGPPQAVQAEITRRVDAMGTVLDRFPHQRLKGRPECKLRVGDYRVLYEFDIPSGRIWLHLVGHRRDIYK